MYPVVKMSFVQVTASTNKIIIANSYLGYIRASFVGQMLFAKMLCHFYKLFIDFPFELFAIG